MKNPHYTFFFLHIECEWSVSQCTYRDTTPLNLLFKSARTFRPLCTAVLVHIRKSKKPFPHLIVSILHAAHSLATASAVHCTDDAIQSDTSVRPQKNVELEATHRMLFCLETVTHKQFVSLSVTHRKSLCLSVTHRKLFWLKVAQRKNQKLQSYPQKYVFG